MNSNFALKKFIITLLSGICIISYSLAQELRFNVIVDSQKLVTGQTAEREIFDDLQKAISNFLNNQQWTNDEFKKEEIISCNLVITLTESPAQNSFRGTAQIQSTRTIYNTNYESNLLFYVDRDFNFRYVEAQPLIFNLNSFTDNLTSILAFYAYVVLALDYDSFSEIGGSPFVENAFNIANIAQQSPEAGWRRSQSTLNRFWLAENLNAQQMIEFRKAIYAYHRHGLDFFLVDPNESRKVILEALKKINEVNRLKPSAVLTNIFFDAKYSELVNIFMEASPEMKKEARDLLIRLDPGHAEKYEALIQN
ncbi:MAG: DUF4835 family protein [Microscillaceae bacterium]|nr:DUF4835 family protein [Microscillaceae bacterium]